MKKYVCRSVKTVGAILTYMRLTPTDQKALPMIVVAYRLLRVEKKT